MPNYNNVQLMGHLTKDPDLRYTQGGTARCKFTLAVNRGGDNDKTDFIPIQCWRGVAESTSEYLEKGRPAFIVGKLRISNYENDDGEQRTYTFVNAKSVIFLGSNNQRKETSEEKPEEKSEPEPDEPPF